MQYNAVTTTQLLLRLLPQQLQQLLLGSIANCRSPNLLIQCITGQGGCVWPVAYPIACLVPTLVSALSPAQRFLSSSLVVARVPGSWND